MSHRSGTPQLGQCVSPAARARRLAVAALRIQLVVPVRDVVTRVPSLFTVHANIA
nr:MAG TPA: hypothetical protein [Caudoviricetes sp.]